MKPAPQIAIGVGGRFHSDWMLDSLLNDGYAAELYTSLPRSRFFAHQRHIHSWILPEIYFRLGRKLGLENWGDERKILGFGKYLANTLSRRRAEKPWDLFIGWSSFALETLQQRPAARHILMRDSSHILHQMKVLHEEYERYGQVFPNRKFVISRELDEYQLCDHIFVLSDFAKRSFISAGISESKLSQLSLGVDTSRFKPAADFSPSRPLRIIFFGTLTLRKGIQYLLEATKGFSSNELALTLVGPVEPDFSKIIGRYSHAKHYPRLPQGELAERIRREHLFIFPTIEDGFGQTLIQAMASGLVPITTESCGAGELIENGKNGFIIPTHSVEPLTELIAKIVKAPEILTGMREEAIGRASQISWQSYASQLSSLVSQQLAEHAKKTNQSKISPKDSSPRPILEPNQMIP